MTTNHTPDIHEALRILRGNLATLAPGTISYRSIERAIANLEDALWVEAPVALVDGTPHPIRLAPGNTCRKAVVIVNDQAVAFGTVMRAAAAAAEINAYEPVYEWVEANDTQPAGFVYVGVAGDILAD